MCDPRFKDKKKFVYASSIFLLLRASGVASRLLNWLVLSDASKKELLYFKIKLFLL